MKKSLIFVVVILMAIPAFANWEIVTDPLAGNYDYNSVAVTQNGTIHIVGDDGKYIIDDGSGFDVQAVPANNSSDYQKILAIDDNTLYICGYGQTILKTENGGTDWVMMYDLGPNNLHDIDFWDTSSGIAVGDDGLILKTINGGENWVEITSPVSKRLNSISVAEDGMAIIVGGLGSSDILISSDYGSTWEQIDSPVNSVLAGVYLDNDGTATAAGYDIVASTDYGSTWEQVTSPTSTTYYSMVYMSENEKGLMVGTNGAILITIDNGSTWSTMANISDEHLMDVFMPDTNSAWAVGFNGTILCNSELAPTTTVEPFSNTPNKFTLEQNYPNPFNPTTSIRYSIPVSSLVTITVYNALGQEVTNLVNELQPAGTHMVNWNGNNMPTGIYFYRMQANDFSRIHKMILMK
jgi:photosystem II stability/assembly factor-like uncharacterized protein